MKLYIPVNIRKTYVFRRESFCIHTHHCILIFFLLRRLCLIIPDSLVLIYFWVLSVTFYNAVNLRFVSIVKILLISRNIFYTVSEVTRFHQSLNHNSHGIPIVLYSTTLLYLLMFKLKFHNFLWVVIKTRCRLCSLDYV